MEGAYCFVHSIVRSFVMLVGSFIMLVRSFDCLFVGSFVRHIACA